ncbi:MAG: DUF167 family protein [Gammaproteobacteria bacterium]
MCYRWDGDSLVIDCMIQPKSTTNSISGVHNNRLKIRIAAPPTDGKANKELVKFLAREFGIIQKSVCIESGFGSRVKRVRITSPSKLIEGVTRK